MKLYFAPRTRATRARWLLEELEVPYELVTLDLARQENTTPEYLSVHPQGEVPALVDGHLTLLDSLSICLHLADRFPEKHLAPPPGSSDRGRYYQGMVFAETRLEPAVMELYKNPQRASDVSMRHPLAVLLDIVDKALGTRDVLVGNTFTAADVLTASLLHLANTLMLLDAHPRLVAYVRRHTQRPAVRRAVSG
ncbi:glutathione S-transferase [Myxococcus stipitatus DSM 14675]|uniref:Glutathione S-transferase n=1 Tax=Myxococcus stipitatus (strain DSM 14675 / JCM 12634 / Mx s8) TaxID=1278073 RepID=L7U8Q2_MYXSD|nr:glutathione S-transferase N-terminal domain-containing protein [Myxococcus stipitatus]AGC45316.1 glutathione S-transferase [Myxococcus stipitatus DSM 14675]